MIVYADDSAVVEARRMMMVIGAFAELVGEPGFDLVDFALLAAEFERDATARGIPLRELRDAQLGKGLRN
jgi:hypothetical protein